MATPTMHRSAHGLTSGDDGPGWRLLAACAQRTVDPDWWSADGATAIGRARHICLTHCLVFADCAKERDGLPSALRKCVTLAGIHHSKDGEPNNDQPLATVCRLCSDKPCPKEQRRVYWRNRKKAAVRLPPPDPSPTVVSPTKRRTPDPLTPRRCEAPGSL